MGPPTSVTTITCGKPEQTPRKKYYLFRLRLEKPMTYCENRKANQMKKLAIIIPSSLLLFAFIIYWYTKPPSILWIDSGTMIAAAASLGIPNPPGFPFYMMASHLATLLPFANILTRLELFTIIFSLLLLFLVYKIIELIIKEYYPLPATRYPLPALTALFGTISLAFSYQYWSQSQNTEAFILSYFFVTLFCFLLLKIQVKSQTANFSDKNFRSHVFKIFLAIAFLYGLAAGANPTVSAMVPGVLYSMFLVRRSLSLPKLFILGTVFALTIAAVYSYLPLRASSWPFVNWGNPQTIELFISHLHGAGLNINEPGPSGSINGFTGSPLVFAQSTSYFFINTFLQFTPILWPLILLGAYQAFKKSRPLFFILISVPIFNIIYSGIYLSGNQESWFILSWIFFAVFIAIGFRTLALRLLNSPVKLLALFSACLLPLIVFFVPLNRSDHYYSADYAYNLYSPLEKNAILIGTGDFFDSLSHYLHSADVYRPDITPVTANVFYVNKWNRDTISHATNLSVSDKLEGMIQYKSFSEYNEVMNQFIAENIDKHPIYVTHLTLRASALAGTNAGQLRLDKRYKFVPNGLSLKVVRAANAIGPDQQSYNFKFKSKLSQTPFYLERNYKGAFENILNDYVYSYEALADWYTDKKDDANALRFFNIAKGLSAKNPEVFAHIANFYATKNDLNAASQYYEKAQKLDVTNVGVHFNLGIIYENLGRRLEAIQEFESVKLLSREGDDVYKEADKLVKELSVASLDDPQLANETKTWERINDNRNNFTIKIPPGFSKKSDDGSYATIVSDNFPGTLGLVMEIVGEPLKENESVEQRLQSSKLILPGTLLDTQKINFSGYIGAVQIYGNQTGDTTQRFVLVRNGWVWQFKISPGNSTKISLIYPILSSFEPLKLK